MLPALISWFFWWSTLLPEKNRARHRSQCDHDPSSGNGWTVPSGEGWRGWEGWGVWGWVGGGRLSRDVFDERMTPYRVQMNLGQNKDIWVEILRILGALNTWNPLYKQFWKYCRSMLSDHQWSAGSWLELVCSAGAALGEENLNRISKMLSRLSWMNIQKSECFFVIRITFLSTASFCAFDLELFCWTPRLAKIPMQLSVRAGKLGESTIFQVCQENLHIRLVENVENILLVDDFRGSKTSNVHFLHVFLDIWNYTTVLNIVEPGDHALVKIKVSQNDHRIHGVLYVPRSFLGCGHWCSTSDPDDWWGWTGAWYCFRWIF